MFKFKYCSISSEDLNRGPEGKAGQVQIVFKNHIKCNQTQYVERGFNRS